MAGMSELNVEEKVRTLDKLIEGSDLSPCHNPQPPGIIYIFYMPDIWFGKKFVNYCKLHM
jgi:hypothetical protein